MVFQPNSKVHSPQKQVCTKSKKGSGRVKIFDGQQLTIDCTGWPTSHLPQKDHSQQMETDIFDICILSMLTGISFPAEVQLPRRGQQINVCSNDYSYFFRHFFSPESFSTEICLWKFFQNIFCHHFLCQSFFS